MKAKWSLLLGLLLLFSQRIGASLSDGEFQLMLSLCEFFNVDFVVFIEDEEPMVGEVKRLSKFNKASSCVTVRDLEDILITQSSDFWLRKTMLTTKKSIPLGPFLGLIENPKLVVWVLFTEPSDALTVGENIPYNGEVLGVKPEVNRLIVYEMLRTPSDTELRSRAFGYIDLETDVIRLPEHSRHRQHKTNLTDVAFRIGVSKDMCGKSKDGYLLDMIACYHSVILDLMAEELGFRKVFVIFEGTKNMFVYPNGSYSGFFKMIVDGKVDMSVAAFVVSKKRLADFNFIWPTFAVKTMMYVKKADAVKAALQGTPFATSVWLSICAWTFVMGSSLFVTQFFDHGRETRTGVWQMMCNSVLKIMQLTCNQGSSVESSSTAYRILQCSTLFGGMLFCYYYSAMVLSYLTVENVDMPFTDFNGFIRRGDYKIIATADGFPIYFLNFEMTRFRYKRKYVMSPDKLPAGVEEGIIQLCDGHLLTLLETKGTLLSMEYAKCELLEIPSAAFDEFFGFATVKPLPFTEYITVVLMRLYEFGIRERMGRNLSKYDNIKALHVDEGYNIVTFEQIMHVLFILNVGIILSAFILVLEKCTYCTKRKRKARHTKNQNNIATAAKIL